MMQDFRLASFLFVHICAFFAGEDFPRSESMGFNRLLSQVRLVNF